MQRTSSLRRAAYVAATVLALWIVATLPSTVINCSYPHGPYEPGFASWWLMMKLSCVVLSPVAAVAGLLAATLQNFGVPHFSKWVPVAILLALLLAGSASYLTAHPGQPNCFP